MASAFGGRVLRDVLKTYRAPSTTTAVSRAQDDVESPPSILGGLSCREQKVQSPDSFLEDLVAHYGATRAVWLEHDQGEEPAIYWLLKNIDASFLPRFTTHYFGPEMWLATAPYLHYGSQFWKCCDDAKTAWILDRIEPRLSEPDVVSRMLTLHSQRSDYSHLFTAVQCYVLIFERVPARVIIELEPEWHFCSFYCWRNVNMGTGLPCIEELSGRIDITWHEPEVRITETTNDRFVSHLSSLLRFPTLITEYLGAMRTIASPESVVAIRVRLDALMAHTELDIIRPFFESGAKGAFCE